MKLIIRPEYMRIESETPQDLAYLKSLGFGQGDLQLTEQQGAHSERGETFTVQIWRKLSSHPENEPGDHRRQGKARDDGTQGDPDRAVLQQAQIVDATDRRGEAEDEVQEERHAGDKEGEAYRDQPDGADGP